MTSQPARARLWRGVVKNAGLTLTRAEERGVGTGCFL